MTFDTPPCTKMTSLVAALALISEGSLKRGTLELSSPLPDAALSALSRQLFKRGVIRDLKEVLASKDLRTLSKFSR